MYGVYQKAAMTLDKSQGHTCAKSALVKRNGKHVQFKREKDAKKWAIENCPKDKEYYVRKVSKEI